MANRTVVTFVPLSDVRAVTVFSDDRSESQRFEAGTPESDVPAGVLKRITDADNKFNGYAFRVDTPKRSDTERVKRGSAGG